MIVMKKNNNKGFSLIELSIVLVIMGLLVAGVTGGASLIKTAQLRTVVTETTNFRSAFNTYYAQFGKVPGAEDSDPSIVMAGNSWYDLHNEGIIDKSPYNVDGNNSSNSNDNIIRSRGTINNGTPSISNSYVLSKFGRSSKFYMLNTGDGNAFDVSFTANFPDEFKNINTLVFSNIDSKVVKNGTLSAIEMKNIDEKLDDGDSTNGLIRGIRADSTGSSSYGLGYDTDSTSTEKATRQWGFINKLDF